jgi:hypothetical protein
VAQYQLAYASAVEYCDDKYFCADEFSLFQQKGKTEMTEAKWNKI